MFGDFLANSFGSESLWRSAENLYARWYFLTQERKLVVSGQWKHCDSLIQLGYPVQLKDLVSLITLGYSSPTDSRTGSIPKRTWNNSISVKEEGNYDMQGNQMLCER